MNTLCAAAAKPKYSPMPRTEPVYSQPFPDYALLREAARTLRLEARLLMMEGKREEAVRIRSLGYGVVRHAAGEPTVIAYLVAQACAGIADSGFADLLHTPHLDEQTTTDVRAAIDNAPRLSLSWSLRGEALYVASFAREARQDDPKMFASAFSEEYDEHDQPVVKPVRPSSKPERALYMDLVDAIEANGLRRLRGAIVAAGEPFPRNRAALERICNPPDDPANPIANASSKGFAGFPNIANIAARAEAQRAVTSAGASVLAFHARTGEWPEGLTTAIATPPTDPFSGKPVLYRREGDGFVVYSVSQDGGFNGGKPSERYPRERYFRYPAVKEKTPQ